MPSPRTKSEVRLWLPIREASHYLGHCPETLRAMIHRGDIPEVFVCRAKTRFKGEDWRIRREFAMNPAAAEKVALAIMEEINGLLGIPPGTPSWLPLREGATIMGISYETARTRIRNNTFPPELVWCEPQNYKIRSVFCYYPNMADELVRRIREGLLMLPESPAAPRTLS